jgi:hypothetical protein
MATDFEIVPHAFDHPNPAGALDRVEQLLPLGIEYIASVPENLGAAFEDARKQLGLRWWLKHPPAAIVEALHTVVELGVALFWRGSFGPDTLVSLLIGGARIEVAGAGSTYTSAPRWAAAVGAAMTLRDEPSLQRLCEFDVRSFQGSYDEYMNDYARAVIAVVRGSGDADALFEQMAASAAAAKKFPERGRRLGIPLAKLAQAIVRGDQAGFDEQLAEALKWYRTLHSRAPDNHEASLIVPLQILGWCAWAHDRGLLSRVRSDYIPAWLVTGSFRGGA